MDTETNRIRPYPIRRTLPLVEAISRDFNDQLLRVLGSQRLMYMDYGKFEEVMATVADVFATWDDNMKDFTNVAREVSRKRQEKFISIKINPAHAQLQERVSYLRAFRRSHEQLRVMTSSTRTFTGLGGDAPFELDMDEEVRLSYESVKNVDVLDVSPGELLCTSDSCLILTYLQRDLRFGTLRKRHTTTELPGSRTRSSRGCETDWPLQRMHRKCLGSSRNSTLSSSDPR